MKKLFFILTASLLLAPASLSAQWMPDVLGEGFEQLAIDQPDDYEGAVQCVLVRSIPSAPTTKAVLYIHGFNDYFFQTEQAQEYNRQLAGTSTGKAPLSDDEGNPITPESYWDLLNVDSAGMMGYIEIPKLNTTIPIYHGTSEAVLQVGVGHLQNTSLPVGGESTHAALSGHRGLPTRSLFTDLDQMEVGDRFYIKVLNETLCYTVDQILTVLPHEMDALAIEEGKDYVTLITCTPYGINSHRLLVRGVRTPYDPQQHQNEIAESTSYLSSMPAQYRHLLIGVVVLVAVLLLRFLVCAVLNIRKRRKHQHE